MNSIKYLFYKAINCVFLSIFSRRSNPLLRFFGSVQKNTHSFLFDFSDKTTHLGDRLFFFPLIYLLIQGGYRVKLSEQDALTGQLFSVIYGYAGLDFSDAKKDDLVIIPQPSYLNFRSKYSNGMLVDFTDCSGALKISEQLIASFQEALNLKLEINHPKAIGRSIEIGSLQHEKGFYLFSNYINSGKFRKYFVDENRLLKKCTELRRQGYKIIHVGSALDAHEDFRSYNFVDLDLRGKLTIVELIDLVSHENVLGAVTYDNFLMHLVGLFHKKALVLFRGRFSRRQYAHHMKHINNTFFDDERYLIYI